MTTGIITKTLAQANKGIGSIIIDAKHAPVAITRHGKPVAILVSPDEFERLERLEDAHWIAESKKALKGGVLSKRESQAFLEKMLAE